MRKITFLILGLLALGVSAGTSKTASAMPMTGVMPQVSNVEQVRWVCGPYRCWWRPNFYPGPYGFYGGGPRFYGPRFGWGGGWHRGWRRW